MKYFFMEIQYPTDEEKYHCVARVTDDETSAKLEWTSVGSEGKNWQWEKEWVAFDADLRYIKYRVLGEKEVKLLKLLGIIKE
jgi:hypothetical protein